MQTKPATYLLSLCLALVPAMLAAQPTELPAREQCQRSKFGDGVVTQARDID